MAATETGAPVDVGEGEAVSARRADPQRVRRGSVLWGLLLRDLTVLDKSLWEFLHNTVTQPLLLVFVFTYLFPLIGQGVGGGEGPRFASLLMAGLLAQAMAFQGMFWVAVPMARELDVTKELEARVLAPTSLTTVAVEKILFGALLSLFAALVVFPVAAFVPATPVYLSVDWTLLGTLVPLACLTSAALGLTVGSLIKPQSVPMLAGTIALPLAFGGAIFYTWSSLDPVPWVKYAVLANPLVYMSEGIRAALIPGVEHMPVPAVYAALGGFALVFTVAGVWGFRRRMLD